MSVAPPPNRSASPAPSRTCSEPLQHVQQLRQCGGVKPAPDLDSTAAPQCHRQTAACWALQHRAAGGLLHLHPAVPGRRTALRLPLSIAGQRGQAQPLLPAELNPAQPAGFVFGHQPLGFRATPASPNFYHLCLFVHPSTASRTAALGQMGCSDAYDQTATADCIWSSTAIHRTSAAQGSPSPCGRASNRPEHTTGATTTAATNWP